MKLCPECGKREIGDRATMCHTCQMRERRAYFRKKGICPECGKNELFGEEKTCIECRAKDAERAIKRYYSIFSNDEEAKKKHNEAQRIRKEKRKKEGICVRCGKRKAEEGRFTCMFCLIKQRNESRMRELWRKE